MGAIDGLLTLFQDTKIDVVCAAAQSFVAVADMEKRHYIKDTLVPNLRNTRSKVRRDAAAALGHVAEKGDREAVALLAAKLLEEPPAGCPTKGDYVIGYG